MAHTLANSGNGSQMIYEPKVYQFKLKLFVIFCAPGFRF